MPRRRSPRSAAGSGGRWTQRRGSLAPPNQVAVGVVGRSRAGRRARAPGGCPRAPAGTPCWRRARRPSRAARHHDERQPLAPVRGRNPDVGDAGPVAVGRRPGPWRPPASSSSTDDEADLRRVPRARRRRRRGAAERAGVVGQPGRRAPSTDTWPAGASAGSRRRTARDGLRHRARAGTPSRPRRAAPATQPASSNRPPVVGADHHLGPRRQAVLGVEGERPLAPPSANGTPGVADRHHGVGPGAEPARGAQQPVADRLGVHGRPRRVRQQAGLLGADPHPRRGARRHRLAGDDVGQRDLGERCRPRRAPCVVGGPRTPSRRAGRSSRARRRGRSGRGSTRRTTTRCPTQCGPRPGRSAHRAGLSSCGAGFGARCGWT